MDEETRSEWHYGETAPAWGSVGLDLGFVFGFGARVDLVELCDFVTSWVGLDLVEDDRHELKRQLEQDEAAAPTDGNTESHERSAPIPGDTPVEEKPR